MKFHKNICIVSIICLITSVSAGCWNYKEVNNIAIVTGFAVDRDIPSGQYIVTVELINPKSGGEAAQLMPVVVGDKGDTIFEAIRKLLRKTGKRLYWSHTKVMIISKDVAMDGIIPVIDLMNRDPETREDIHLIISKQNTAAEILDCEPQTFDTISFQLEGALRNEFTLPRLVDTEIWQFTRQLSEEGISPVLGAADKHNSGGKEVAEFHGSAVLRGDKFLGFLNDIETRSYLFVRNKVREGLVVTVSDIGKKKIAASLEIKNCETSIKSGFSDGNPVMEVKVIPSVVIAEIQGTDNLIDKKGRMDLKKHCDNEIKREIEETIEKVQREYRVDIFGFGKAVHMRSPSLWKKLESDWENVFSNMEVNVDVDTRIIGSALKSKPVKLGD